MLQQFGMHVRFILRKGGSISSVTCSSAGGAVSGLPGAPGGGTAAAHPEGAEVAAPGM